jgi:hypothetical protein
MCFYSNYDELILKIKSIYYFNIFSIKNNFISQYKTHTK